MKNTIVEEIKNNKNPYYICAPSYTEESAGIKALHLLCHHLNLLGYPAFIANLIEHAYETNPNLITPIATDCALEIHKINNKTPIVIYPDTIKGNPLNSKCNVRYLLHYAGALGGDKEFGSNDIIFTYTKKIAEKLGTETSNILFMPICNTDIFYPPKIENRSGSCFYASKYRLFTGKDTFDITKNSVEITRYQDDSQTTEEIAELFRKSEVFYSYEDTSLITEAILCGCPAILIKNEFFNGEGLAAYELGSEGSAPHSQDLNIKKIKEEIPEAQKKFFSSIDNFHSQLENFIKITQEFSQKFQDQPCEIKLFKQKRKKPPIGRILKTKAKKILNLSPIRT